MCTESMQPIGEGALASGWRSFSTHGTDDGEIWSSHGRMMEMIVAMRILMVCERCPSLLYYALQPGGPGLDCDTCPGRMHRNINHVAADEAAGRSPMSDGQTCQPRNMHSPGHEARVWGGREARLLIARGARRG